MSDLPREVWCVIGPYGWVFNEDRTELRRNYGRLIIHRFVPDGTRDECRDDGKLTRPEPVRHPLDARRRCAHCGELTRITTAGCDHCDVEDK